MKHFLRRTMLLSLVALLLFSVFTPLASAASYRGRVNANKVFLRSRADTDSTAITSLDKGERVDVLGIRGDFYKVRAGSRTGYIVKTFVDAPEADKAFGKKDEPSINVRSYTSARTIKDLGRAPRACKPGDKSEDVAKLQRALQIKGFLSGKVDGDYGEGTERAVRRYQRSVKLEDDGIAGRLTIEKLFTISTEVSRRDDPGMQGISRISDIRLPATSKPGASGSAVRSLQQALKLKGYFKEAISGDYDSKTRDAVKRFQKSRRLSQDGIAGNATIKALFGKNATDYSIPTQKLDWFENGSSTIPKRATFTIKDVSTGKTFTARRWSGVNHVDAEPVSSRDARVMKEISGGSYSWARRAVLVRYNGQVYAGSINTMPHGTSTISGNDFAGHFCLHFSGSKTHESNRVDSTHQGAVNRALRHEW